MNANALVAVGSCDIHTCGNCVPIAREWERDVLPSLLLLVLLFVLLLVLLQ